MYYEKFDAIRIKIEAHCPSASSEDIRACVATLIADPTPGSMNKCGCGCGLDRQLADRVNLKLSELIYRQRKGDE